MRKKVKVTKSMVMDHIIRVAFIMESVKAEATFNGATKNHMMANGKLERSMVAEYGKVTITFHMSVNGETI